MFRKHAYYDKFYVYLNINQGCNWVGISLVVPGKTYACTLRCRTFYILVFFRNSNGFKGKMNE